MKATRLILLTLIVSLCFTCSSSDDSNEEEECTKTIVVQPQQVVTGPTGTSVIPEVTQEVPCDFVPDDVLPIGTNVTELENFSYQILTFNFIPDTGNDTRILQFEIQLNNPNNFVAEGRPILTTDVDGLITAGSGLTQYASNPCFSIDANSNCIYMVDIEESLIVGIINDYTIIDVDYWLNPED